MTTARKLEALCACPLFSGISASTVRQLSEFFEQLDGGPGDQLFLEDEPGGSLYVVVSGNCRARTSGPRGETLTVQTLSSPSSFGELSLVTDSTRMTSVEALDTVCVLELNQTAFARMRAQSPELALELVLAIAREAGRSIEATRELLVQLVAQRTPVAAS